MNQSHIDGAKADLRTLIHAHDWSASAIGDRASWPRCLETVLDLMLSSKFAMCLGWGPELTLLYNDAYVPFLGARHPAALGQPLREVWAEVWTDIEPSVASAMAGIPVDHVDLPRIMTRHGYPEETWLTFAYSPLRDDDGMVAGFLDIATETTGKVVHERDLMKREAQLRALNQDLESQIVERGRERAMTWAVTSELLSVIDLRTACFNRVNPAWAATLGWTPQEMEGSPFSDFVLPDDSRRSADAFDAVREGNPVSRFDNRY